MLICRQYSGVEEEIEDFGEGKGHCRGGEFSR